MLKLLKESLGIDKKKRTTEYHDLDGLAGTWSSSDAAEFAQATAVFEKIDEDMWKKSVFFPVWQRKGWYEA
ncbi:MAG: hypothetical protein PHY09_08870 [Desulfuromonadaceae bacterium]|nr:hypothetical protein [Desulfuromonadaceae bacterium]MDD5107518.1 hypothetical protein [Desulfuromonadaceae bacterium]